MFKSYATYIQNSIPGKTKKEINKKKNAIVLDYSTLYFV
jgi:hypothetical protein